MKKLFSVLLAGVLWAAPQSGKPTTPAPKEAPKALEQAKQLVKDPKPAAQENKPAAKPSKAETLHYNVNWPSGLSLGEAALSSGGGEADLNFSFKLDASIPGFAVSETATSSANKDYCSVELVKKGTRGKRQVDETTKFDIAGMKATRKTGTGGGTTELSTSSCAKDALAFIYFLRRELAAGRLPAQQKVYYGSPYTVRVVFSGTQVLNVGGESIEADKLVATIKGPAFETTADLFFSKDAKRTPLLIQAPLAMGKFGMELVR